MQEFENHLSRSLFPGVALLFESYFILYLYCCRNVHCTVLYECTERRISVLIQFALHRCAESVVSGFQQIHS